MHTSIHNKLIKMSVSSCEKSYIGRSFYNNTVDDVFAYTQGLLRACTLFVLQKYTQTMNTKYETKKKLIIYSISPKIYPNNEHKI